VTARRFLAARLPAIARTGTITTPLELAVSPPTARLPSVRALALAMLAEPTPAQREVLGAMPYSRNTTQLHTDTSVLPRHRGARASWNYLRRPRSTGAVTVTYDLTRLMRLPVPADGRRFLVTLGGEDLVDPATVIDRMEYEHPLYTPESVAAQRRLPECDSERIVFAGAYHGWGFHEDGARSGLAAATRLGLPWTRDSRVLPAPGRFETTIRHTRRTPFRRSFDHASTFWPLDLDDLPDHGIARRQHAADRRNQRLTPRQAATDRGQAPLQAGDFALGGIDILLRHRIGQFAQTGQALFGQAQAGLQLRQQRRLVGALDGAGSRHHPGQDFALPDLAAGGRQAMRPGGFDPPRNHRLDAAADVRVHDHPARQFKRARQAFLSHARGQHGHPALRRLG